MTLITNEAHPRIVSTVEAPLPSTNGEWKRVNLTLPAARLTFSNCSLALQFDGQSVLYVDAAQLEPAAAHRWNGMHIRQDIGEAIGGAGLRFLRFGGDMAESAEPLPFGYT